MKKLLAMLVLAIAGVTSATAQDYILNNPSNHRYWGIRASGQVTCPGQLKAEGIGADVFNNGGGFEIGGICNAPVIANFYVEPGLMLYYNTYSYKKELVENNHACIKKFGFRVPVMFGYHFDFTETVKLSVFTGPELEIGLTANEHTSTSSTNHSEGLYDSDGGMNRFDVLWGFGAGITCNHFYFGVSGALGLCNMLNQGKLVKFHENLVSFSVGYNF